MTIVPAAILACIASQTAQVCVSCHLERFTACLLGPDVTLPPVCQLYDMDADGDVDLCDVHQMLSLEVAEAWRD